MKTEPILITNPTTSQQAKIIKAQQAAKDFESMFVNMMLKEMRKTTLDDNPLVPKNTGETIFTDMLDSEYSKLLSGRNSLGMEKMILKQLQDTDPSLAGLDLLKDLTSTNALPWATQSRFFSSAIPQSNKPASVLDRVAAWTDTISLASETYCLDKNLISAVIAQESGGNQYAVSKKGARGLMQLMDGTAADLGVPRGRVFDPKNNIMGGAKYLRQMLDMFGGDEKHALAAYNAGPHRVRQYNGIPPFAETRNYVTSVGQLKSQFADRDATTTKETSHE